MLMKLTRGVFFIFLSAVIIIIIHIRDNKNRFNLPSHAHQVGYTAHTSISDIRLKWIEESLEIGLK